MNAADKVPLLWNHIYVNCWLLFQV